MTVAMLRLADEIGGEIKIDGVPHASMSHATLRSKLAIIPQEGTDLLSLCLSLFLCPLPPLSLILSLSLCACVNALSSQQPMICILHTTS